MITRRGFFRWTGRMVLGGIALGGYGVGIEPLLRRLITRYRPQPPLWPADLKLTIAVVADIHAVEPWMPVGRIRSIVDQTNGLGADVIVLLGDFVSSMRFRYGAVAPAAWADELARLTAPLGVHAVLGNHDYWSDREALRRRDGRTIAGDALKAVGIPVYLNEAVRIVKDGRPFWLAGLGDQVAYPLGRRNYLGVDDLDKTLAAITDDAPAILLAHEPDVFAHSSDRFALTLSGHTHGGQIRLLGYAPVVPSQFGNRYVYGHIVENDQHLIVSGGLGCSGIPVRFGSPPEIVVVELGA